MGISAQHHTQTGIFSSEKSRLWQELPAPGLAAECEQVWCNSCSRDSGTLPCGAPADPAGECVLQVELCLLKQVPEKGQEGHQQLPPVQQASLLG